MSNKEDTLFNKWIFSEFKPVNKSLHIFRVVYVLFILVIVLPEYLWISHYPDSFFLPRIGITLIFGGFPDITFFYILNFLLIASLLALLIGYKTVYSSIAVALLLFIGNAWSYSFGKVNHDIFFILIPLLLSVSYWGENPSNNKNNPKRYSWPVPIFALLIGLAMFTAALAKIATGWLDPSASALTGHLVRNYYVTGRETVLASYLLSVNNFYLFKFLDYSTLILESAFIFSIFSLRYFRLVCAMACLFHFGVQLTMEIAFTPNIIAYAMFVNWSYLYKFKTVKTWFDKLGNLSYTNGILGLTIVSILLWLLYITFGNPFSLDFGLTSILGGNLGETLIMIIAVVISLKYIFQILHEVIEKYIIHNTWHKPAYKS